MHIAIICHYFVPEVGAPSARLFDLARYWTRDGHRVSVITNFPNHPTGIIHEGYRGCSFMTEEIEGVGVIRCRTFATPNKGIIKKTLGHLVFMVMAVLQGKKEIKDVDVIVVSSPNLFSVISAWWCGKRMRKPYIFEVRDLWPAIFVELGVLKNRFIIKTLETLEMFLYRRAAKVVTVTASFKKGIINRGIEESKIHFIPNGADVTRFQPAQPNSELIKRLGLKMKFIILYCGAHGISHALKNIVNAAELLQKEKDIHFLFVGDGAEKDGVIEYSQRLNLKNITFLPSQPKEVIPDFYNIADICLVPLRNIPLFATFIPSKMFEIMACGRPIIASLKGEAADILERSKAAVIVPPEDYKAVAGAVMELKNNLEKRKKLSKNGPPFVLKEFDRFKLARQYLEIIEKVKK